MGEPHGIAWACMGSLVPKLHFSCLQANVLFLVLSILALSITAFTILAGRYTLVTLICLSLITLASIVCLASLSIWINIGFTARHVKRGLVEHMGSAHSPSPGDDQAERSGLGAGSPRPSGPQTDESLQDHHGIRGTAVSEGVMEPGVDAQGLGRDLRAEGLQVRDGQSSWDHVTSSSSTRGNAAVMLRGANAPEPSPGEGYSLWAGVMGRQNRVVPSEIDM